MTDREMLELAAKAGGISGYRYSENFYCMAHWNESDGGWFDACGLWDPLRNDGDAFRLAVKLNLLYAKAFARSVVEHLEGGDDIYLATRRAITIAAAEIGREMK